MTSANIPNGAEFFQLAARVLGGTASAEEKSKLETCVHDNSEFRKAFEHMQAITQSERDDHFMQTAIRVILNQASSEELQEINSLDVDNPALWRRFQFLRSVFTGLAREAALGDTIQTEPMPDRVRQTLLAKLREAKS